MSHKNVCNNWQSKQILKKKLHMCVCILKDSITYSLEVYLKSNTSVESSPSTLRTVVRFLTKVFIYSESAWYFFGICDKIK